MLLLFYAGFVRFRMGNERGITIPKLCNNRLKPKNFFINRLKPKNFLIQIFGPKLCQKTIITKTRQINAFTFFMQVLFDFVWATSPVRLLPLQIQLK